MTLRLLLAMTACMSPSLIQQLFCNLWLYFNITDLCWVWSLTEYVNRNTVFCLCVQMSGVKLSSVLPGMTLTATVTKVSSLFSVCYHIVRYQSARCPLLSYGYRYEASCARPGKAIIRNFWHLGTLTLRHSDAQRWASALMSKMTNDGLTWSGTRCFIIAVRICAYGNSGCQRVN